MTAPALNLVGETYFPVDPYKERTKTRIKRMLEPALFKYFIKKSERIEPNNPPAFPEKLMSVTFPKLRFNSPAVENMSPRKLKLLSSRKENLRVIKSRTEK